MHRDVRDAIRLFLLPAESRAEVRAMSRRAVDHLTEVLAAKGYASVDQQLGDGSWRTAALALLWHTFWLDPDDGMALLLHLFPAAEVLQEEFATALVDVGHFFTEQCDRSAGELLNSLWGPRVRRRITADLIRRVAEAAPEHTLLAWPTTIYLDLLRGQLGAQLGLDVVERVKVLRDAAKHVPPDGSDTARRLGQIALGLWRYVEDTARTAELQRALVASGRLAVRYLPHDAVAHSNLGSFLYDLGKY